MRIVLWIFIFIIFNGQLSFAQNNTESFVQEILSKKEYKNATAGILFTEIESGRILFGIDANKPVIPASILKIITTASALEMLGNDYRFKTQIAYRGEIQKGNLDGDLLIIGGGDPTLGSEYFKAYNDVYNFIDIWIEEIKSFGVRKIEGDLIFDGSNFDKEKIPPTWIWEDMGNYYGAGANAFTVYDNLFRITFKSPKKAGELSEIVSINPEMENLKIKNEVLSSEINRDLAYVFGSPIDNNRVIRGTIPRGQKAFTIKAAIHDPVQILANDLLKKLAKEGIFITGKIKFEMTEKENNHLIYVHRSPELFEIAKLINYKSVNLFAEHLVRQIAFKKAGFGSREKGIEIIKEFWLSKGLPGNQLFLEDGSGLSHFNAVSPSQFVFILTYMQKQSENPVSFFNTFPEAGNGTLSSFSSDSFPGNSLKAKSGSMTRVRCYAGYLTTDSNKKIAFAIMVNHFNGSGIDLSEEIEKLLLKVKTNY